MKTKIYHIYEDDSCLLHSIPEEEFESIWRFLNEYKKGTLSYEELEIHKEFAY